MTLSTRPWIQDVFRHELKMVIKVFWILAALKHRQFYKLGLLSPRVLDQDHIKNKRLKGKCAKNTTFVGFLCCFGHNSHSIRSSKMASSNDLSEDQARCVGMNVVSLVFINDFRLTFIHLQGLNCKMVRSWHTSRSYHQRQQMPS